MTGHSRVTLPNFVLVGVPKAGTTSLHYYLSQHPDVFVPVQKELHFFSYHLLQKNTEGAGDKAALEGLCGTLDEYKEHYLDVRDERAIGDISPSYFFFSEVSGDILRQLGSVKIIIALRNPVERAYSNYMHMVRDGREMLGFYEALMAEEKRKKEGWGDFWRYAEHSLYHERTKTYISTFGFDNVHIVIFEEIVSDTIGVVNKLFEFLGVDPGFIPNLRGAMNPSGRPRSMLLSRLMHTHSPFKRGIRCILGGRLSSAIKFNVASLNLRKKEVMDPRARKYLTDYCREDVLRLQDLIGRNLSAWLKDMEDSPEGGSES